MKEYSIIDASNSQYDASNSQYDASRIRLVNGKTCFFFKNKGSAIKEVIISKKFDKPLRDGEIFLYLKDINDSKDIKKMINAFYNELHKIGIDIRKFKVSIVLDTELEKEILASVVSELGIIPEFVINERRAVNSNDKNNNLNQELVALGNSKEIVKEDNGISKHYVVNDGKVYNDNDNLSLAEQKKILLESWMKDPVMSREISQLSNLELDDLLMGHVTSNKKEYYMEQSNNMVNNDKKTEMAKNQVSLNDGRGNAELGIIENAPNKENQYSTIEEDNDKYRVVTPEVSSSVISSNNSGSTVSSGTITSEGNSVNISNEREQIRNIDDTVFYIDDDYKIYNADGEELGMIGRNGYFVDYANNCLTKDGKAVGYIGDINSMSNTKDRDKPMVKTLRKDDNRAAFVSFPIILLTLSLLLFIGSIILYFMS